MPQILGLPVDEPVAGPQAKPGIFGAVGGAIEGMGQEVEQMAAGNQQFEQHLIEAQRYLKAKQAEIAYDGVLNQVHADLAKTTTPEDAQKVYDHAKGQLAGVLQPFETDRVLSRQLAIFGAEQDVQLQNTVNGRKATLIQKGDEQANDLLYKKSLEEGINTTIGNGDPSVARDQLKSKLDASVHVMGTMTPQQAESIMDQWDTDYEKGLIEAYTNSSSPATRKQNIANLGIGNVPHIDKATQNALLTKAKSRDRELTNLAESQDYNGAVNKFDDLTKGWTYEDKVKALEDGQFLKDNGFVDEQGNPDRKKADMLLEEADRGETRGRKIQTDKDNDVISKLLDDVDSGKLSAPQIDAKVREEGGSPRAASTLKSARRDILRQELELGSLSMQARAMQRQEWQDNSMDALGKIQRDMQNGIRHSDEEINGMLGRGPGKMSSQQVSEALRMSHSYETDPTNKPFYNTIWNQKFDNDAVSGEAISELDKYIREHPTASSVEKAKAVKEILEPKNVERINKALDGVGDVFNPTPQRPKGVPANAVWNPEKGTWQLPQ